MSADPIFTVWCDWPTCLRFTAEGAFTAREAREEAQSQGWAVGLMNKTGDSRRRLDYCPEHTPK